MVVILTPIVFMVVGIPGFCWNLMFFFLTLPETNSSPMKIPIFPGKYHQNGGFSMAIC